MAESLSEKQRRFTYLLTQLLQWAYAHGYEITVGDAYRDPRVFGIMGESPVVYNAAREPHAVYGHKRSNHKLRLAMDLNLFKDGTYKTQTAQYQELGEYWESLAPDARWGGRFADGNHFSLEHKGTM